MKQKTNTDLKDSIDLVKMNHGPIPANVGFPRGMKGVTRTLTARELRQQKQLRA